MQTDVHLPRHSQITDRAGKSKLTPDDLKALIRSINLKVTQPRLVILQALQTGRAHMTAQEVFEKISKVDSSVGFATVYRFLRKLSDAGHVTEVRVGGMPARYEMAPTKHHDHLTCTHCGKINEFANQRIEMLQEQIASEMGFVLKHHVLELYGICPDCQRREAKLAGKD